MTQTLGMSSRISYSLLSHRQHSAFAGDEAAPALGVALLVAQICRPAGDVHLCNLGLRRRGFAEPPSPTGPRKLFKEVTAAHVGRHCSGFPGYFLSGTLCELRGLCRHSHFGFGPSQRTFNV